MKNLSLAFLFTLISSSLFAQYNFNKLSAGLNVGGTYGFGDPEKGKFNLSTAISGDYFLTPFITTGLEIQIGKISGGDTETDPHFREFTNSYKAFVFNGKARLGQITDFYYNDFLNLTKGFYVGSGLGVIQNNLTKINRIKPDGSGYVFPGLDKSTNLVVPVNIGIDFFFFDKWGDPRYIFNVNLQQNVVIGEGMDGYNDPPPFQNNAPDFYSFISVGFKYTFGPKGLANKTIR